MFSIVPKSNTERCQVFLLYSIAFWTIAKCKAFLLDTKKIYNNTVLL